jgi:hypothetical protein
MSCHDPVIIGATCDDQIEYGETIDLSFVYTNDDGSPINLTDATISVFSSSPSIIKEAAEVTITDAANGVARFLLRRDDALGLRRGANNRFRIQAVFGPDSDDMTPDIYIQVT